VIEQSKEFINPSAVSEESVVRMGTKTSLYGEGYYPRGFINPSAVSEESAFGEGTETALSVKEKKQSEEFINPSAVSEESVVRMGTETELAAAGTVQGKTV
jgi:peptide deformylase